MADSYSQISVHIVFATRMREALIPPEHKEEIHKYITGIVEKGGHKMLAINSMPDYIHIFLGLNPSIALADLVRDIKANSSSFITKKGLCPTRFHWQEGYAAFSYAHSQRETVITYIRDQEQHHKRVSFRDEYLKTLKAFKVEFSEQYLFDDR